MQENKPGEEEADDVERRQNEQVDGINEPRRADAFIEKLAQIGSQNPGQFIFDHTRRSVHHVVKSFKTSSENGEFLASDF